MTGPATPPKAPASREQRLAQLYTAQASAEALFEAIADQGLIRPGVSEMTVSKDIQQLARDLFQTSAHWHKRLVRAGINTLEPYSENPPDRVINEDDIVFVDLGPVFEDWEADFGRSYVLGDDPVKHRLVADLPRAFATARNAFDSNPEITGEQLYQLCLDTAADLGWQYGGPLAGHLVGEFPHNRLYTTDCVNVIMPGNAVRMRSPDPTGLDRFWILEIHLTDPERGIGGFYEQLLTT